MPVFAWRVAHILLEHTVEVLRILIPQFVGNLADSFLASNNHLLGQVDDFVLDIFLCRLPGFLLYQVSEIIGREEYLVCKVFHGGKPVGLRFVALEIVVYQRFEFRQDVLVCSRAGDELAFVEAFAIIKQ